MLIGKPVQCCIVGGILQSSQGIKMSPMSRAVRSDVGAMVLSISTRRGVLLSVSRHLIWSSLVTHMQSQISTSFAPPICLCGIRLIGEHLAFFTPHRNFHINVDMDLRKLDGKGIGSALNMYRICGRIVILYAAGLPIQDSSFFAKSVVWASSLVSRGLRQELVNAFVELVRVIPKYGILLSFQLQGKYLCSLSLSVCDIPRLRISDLVKLNL